MRQKGLFANIEIEEAEKEIIDLSKKISFTTAEFTIELLVEKLKSGDLYIPDYQREDVWKLNRKAKFIESVMMGLPIPFLFFWENGETGKLEIVDGVQRLHALQQYISPKIGEKWLKLESLEEMPALNGSIFTDLLEARQRKFKNKTIRANILGENADSEARFEMFERINTGSEHASQAEIRRGAFQGAFLRMIQDLTKEEDFKKFVPLSQGKLARRDDEELLTRFFAYSDGIEEYKGSPKTFVANYTKKINEAFEKDKNLEEKYRERWHKVLRFVVENFPNGFGKTENETPHARFEALAVGTYTALQENPVLEAPQGTKEYFTPAQKNDQKTEFDIIVASDAANNRLKLENRIDFVKRYLLGD